MRINQITGIFSFPRRMLWRSRIHRWNIGYPDPELRYLPKLCKPFQIAIDVGASLGLYTSHLLTCSRKVLAFEPRSDAVSDLKQVFSNAPVKVYPLALSDTDSESTMVVCTSDLGRSILESANPVMGKQENVLTRLLDSFNLEDVGFIKIDVEGYEEAVLNGAKGTIQKHRPNLLIEIEERHKPGATTRIPLMLEEMGYSGWFLLEGQWHPLSKFEVSKHQCENGLKYINNFVFLPIDHKNPLI